MRSRLFPFPVSFDYATVNESLIDFNKEPT